MLCCRMVNAPPSAAVSAWFEILSHLSLLTLTIDYGEYMPRGLEIESDRVKLSFDGQRTAVARLPRHVDPRSVRIMGLGWGLDIKLNLLSKMEGPPLDRSVAGDDSALETLLINTQSIECRMCKSSIYNRNNPRSRVARCRSLPSDHWGELSECWSCHNEDFTKMPGQDQNGVIAQRDVIMYSRCYLLLHGDNLNMNSLISTVGETVLYLPCFWSGLEK